MAVTTGFNCAGVDKNKFIDYTNKVNQHIKIGMIVGINK